jgi:ABC-type bacteriocin/lantibiotic exporter with double-glycine peptidase domain
MYSTTLYVATAILGTLMAIYPQPNDWECGPYALKYALIVLGISGDEREIARIAGTDEHGTDEAELARAAKRYGCETSATARPGGEQK